MLNPEADKKFRRFIILGVIATGFLGLAGCVQANEPKSQAPLPPMVEPGGTELPPPLSTSTPEPEPTLTVLTEPTIAPTAESDLLPVNPPQFDVQPNPESTGTASFTLTEAHAIYALYRDEIGPGHWDDEAKFVQAMEQYYQSTLAPNGVEIQQAATPGHRYTLLTRKTGPETQMLLSFNKQGEALSNYAPGLWSPDSTPTWVNAGGSVKLFVGPDNLAYIGRLDPETREVTSFFNPLGATSSNLEEHWVPVVAGQVAARWDEQTKEWTSELPPCDLFYEFEETAETYFGITNKEMSGVSTTLTLADLKDPSLGLMLEGNDQLGPFQIMSGRIAKAYPITLNLEGKKVPGLIALIDIPTPDGQNWGRIPLIIDRKTYELGSVLPLKPHLDVFTQLKLNPPSSTIDDKLLWDTAKALGYENSDLTFPQKERLSLFDAMQKNPDKLVGAPIAFRQPPAYNKTLDVDIPHPFAKYLAGKATKEEVLKENEQYNIISNDSQLYYTFINLTDK